MAKNKPTLPPRKWYSLQQAADKLTRELGESVTIDDLLHYCQIELLNISVYVGKALSVIRIGDLVFSEIELKNEEKILPKKYLNFHILGDYQKNISIEHIFDFRKGIQTEYTNGLVKMTLSGYDEKFDDVILIDGFMNLWAPIGNNPKDIKCIKEKGLRINGMQYLISPNRNEDFRIVIQMSLDWKCQEDIFISLENIYILESDLNAFIEGKEKSIDINEVIEKSKIGRPKDARYKEIVETAKKLFLKYPEANRESIKNTVMDLLNIDGLSDEQIRRYLKENEIGKLGGSSISNMSL